MSSLFRRLSRGKTFAVCPSVNSHPGAHHTHSHSHARSLQQRIPYGLVRPISAGRRRVKRRLRTPLAEVKSDHGVSVSSATTSSDARASGAVSAALYAVALPGDRWNGPKHRYLARTVVNLHAVSHASTHTGLALTNTCRVIIRPSFFAPISQTRARTDALFEWRESGIGTWKLSRIHPDYSLLCVADL